MAVFFRLTDNAESKCEPMCVPMDISDDSNEKINQPSEKESPSEIEEESDKSSRLKVHAIIIYLKCKKLLYQMQRCSVIVFDIA